MARHLRKSPFNFGGEFEFSCIRSDGKGIGIIYIFSRSWLLGWSRCKNLYLELCMSCWIKRYVWNRSHSTHRITYQINVGSDGIEFAWITCGEGAVIYAVGVDDGIICGPMPWGPIPWGPIPWGPIPWGPIIWGLITCGEGFINAAEVDGGAARKENVDACAAEKKNSLEFR